MTQGTGIWHLRSVGLFAVPSGTHHDEGNR